MTTRNYLIISPSSPPIPAGLDPTTAEYIRDIYRSGTSENTARAYAHAIQYFRAWHATRYPHRGGTMLPVPVTTILTFIADNLGNMPPSIESALTAPRIGVKGLRPLKQPGRVSMNTLKLYISVISKLHHINGYESENPCRSPFVRELLQKASNALAAGGGTRTPTRKAEAAPRDVVERLVSTCGGDLAGLRDQALIWAAWASGGRRRSEAVAMEYLCLREVAGGYLYSLGKRKNSQSGEDKVIPILDQAGEAMSRWLSASGIASGYIFRAFTRSGGLRESLSAHAANEILKMRAKRAGLNGRYTFHSLRAGFVTETGRQNIHVAYGMGLTDHASVSVFMGYHRDGAVMHNPAARLSKHRHFRDEND